LQADDQGPAASIAAGPFDAPRAQRRALLFILLTVALDSLGLGILVPVVPRLILELSGAGLARAAVYGGWLTATFAIVQFMAGPLLGSLSDRVGRRPVLLISLAAFGCSYVLMGLAPSLAWLFVAQALTGLFGATPATAGAFIADVTTSANRTRHFGSMAAAFGTGLIVGPALGGLLVVYGTRVPFLVAAGLSLITVVYGLLVLPESLPHALRRPMTLRRANPFGAMLQLASVGGVAVLFGAVLLQRVSSNTLPAIWPYFTMQEYGWTARDVGYSLAVFGLATVLIQAWLLRGIDERIGTRQTASLGLMMLAIGYLGFAFGHGPWIVALCIPLATMGFMAGPALASMLSLSVGADEQGTMQGVLASLNGVAAVLTPLLMPWMFSTFSMGAFGLRFPGAPYLLSAVLALAGVLLVRRSGLRRDSI
jgi:MFS transporter, DHA1 family, tetracycline resistance protein